MSAANVSPAPVTIEDFIEARLREDEEAAGQSTRPDWDATPEGSVWDSSGWVADVGGDLNQHVARHDPRSTLDRCEAVRKIMRVADDVELSDSGAAIQLNEAIASFWRHHPDFRKEWAE